MSRPATSSKEPLFLRDSSEDPESCSDTEEPKLTVSELERRLSKQSKDLTAKFRQMLKRPKPVQREIEELRKNLRGVMDLEEWETASDADILRKAVEAVSNYKALRSRHRTLLETKNENEALAAADRKRLEETELRLLKAKERIKGLSDTLDHYRATEKELQRDLRKAGWLRRYD
ncbi:unnamed protein product [Peniophora sp. CBMAI 1063]|nr:unnamed protein product [Peniophora sp. CBMAI 1063]